MTIRAQDQLDRLLLALPHLAEDTELPLAELAERVGTDERTLMRDLEALGTHDRDVAGFVEAVELFVGPTGVGARTSFFKRPMRLSRAELAALDLGLGMLLLERPLEERATIMAARVKLRTASVSSLAGVSMAGSTPSARAVATDDAQSQVAVEAAPERLREHFGALWQARDERRAVRLEYRREGATDAESRVVHPWAVVRAFQHVYVIGWCTSVTAVRVFRLDRIVSVSLDGATFEVPADFDVHSVMRDGRIFVGERPHDTLVVRYSPLVARWIAEREGVSVEPDGSVTVEWPVADDEWAVRHVLQYGADATVLAPERIRAAVIARLESLMALDKSS